MGDEVDRLMVQGRAYQTLVQGCTSYRDPGAGFAINAMDPYGAPPFVPMRRQPWPAGMQIGARPMPHGMPPTLSGESIMAECRKHGCMEIRQEFDIALLQTVYTHIGPHHEHTSIAVPDHLRMGGGNEVRAFLLEWLQSIHADAPLPDALERDRCPLCGAVREPDVEPVEMELPGVAVPPGPMPLRKAEREGFYVIDACSQACATAYAIATDPVRERPALGVALEQRHQERVRSDARQAVRKNGGRVSDDVTGSKDAHDAWNPWKEPAD